MGWSGIKDHGFGSKNRTKAQDDEYRSRIGGKPRVRKWSDERIKDFFDELLDVYKKILLEDIKVESGNAKKLKQETIRDMNVMVRRLLDFKEAYYPPVNKNLNVNVEVSAKKYGERIKKRMMEKYNIVFVEKDSEEGKEEEEEESEL